MITAQEYIVMDGNAPSVNITLDPENKVGEQQLFLLEQEGIVIYVSEDMLVELTMAAHRLRAGQMARKQEYLSAQSE